VGAATVQSEVGCGWVTTPSISLLDLLKVQRTDPAMECEMDVKLLVFGMLVMELGPQTALERGWGWKYWGRGGWLTRVPVRACLG